MFLICWRYRLFLISFFDSQVLFKQGLWEYQDSWLMTILSVTMLFWDRVRRLFWQRPCYFEAESGDYSDRDHVILRQSQVTLLTEAMLFWDRVRWLFWQWLYEFLTKSGDSYERDHDMASQEYIVRSAHNWEPGAPCLKVFFFQTT